MKKLILALVACIMALGIVASSNALVVVGDPFDGGSWGQRFQTTGLSNLLNLFCTVPFKHAEVPSGWSHWQNKSGYWAQLFTTGSPTVIQWTHHWWGDITSVCLDWWEASYDWSTGTIEQCSSGGLSYTCSDDGGAWETADFGSAGGFESCSVPVPEPSTLLLLGSGLVGLAGYGKLRFRRRKK